MVKLLKTFIAGGLVSTALISQVPQAYAAQQEITTHTAKTVTTKVKVLGAVSITSVGDGCAVANLGSVNNIVAKGNVKTQAKITGALLVQSIGKGTAKFNMGNVGDAATCATKR